AGIKLTANLIELCTPLGRNVGLARVHDYHFCPLLNPDLSPHVGGHIEEGCDSVLVNGLPAVRVRDHAVCMGNQDVIAEGVEDLSIAKQAAATGSSTSWHGGAITECSLNVISTTKSCATFANQSHSAIPLAERWLSVQEL
ncbi:MAG TPA: PAAR domain-containing protein, partial [Coxiellaceae bacterium]|nr:PAAR domain-containing protein [Coxiellaceae bacterium]